VVSTADAKAIWAGITVANLEVSRKWYEEKLGFKLVRNLDLPEHKLRIAFLELNGFTLELIAFQQSVSLSTIQSRLPELKDRDHLQGFVKLGFRIPNVGMLASALKANGVKLRMEPTNDPEFHDRFLLAEDPDSNTLQFFQEMR
jgi:catechol 2,3-dioxygenase-like lactoylglutathione lyase family enzyme